MSEPLDDSFLDWEEWDPQHGTFLSHVIAGSIAGITEHTIMYPVDTLKTHVQCARCGKVAKPGLMKGAEGCVHALKSLVRSEGFFRLWRGVNTMFLACIPAHAAYFSVYESIKARTGANKPGHHPLAAASSGVFATLAHDMIMTPMDTVKQRLQLGYYRGISHCVTSMVRKEGYRALFLSLPTTLTMNLPFGAIMVTTNESMKKFLGGPNGERATMSTYLIAGSVAGAIASLATTPLDMIKTRLQTQHFSSAPSVQLSRLSVKMTSNPMTQPARHAMTMTGSHKLPSGKSKVPLRGAYDSARAIYTEAGMMGFWRGAIPRLLVAAPSVSISWTAYELAKSYLNEHV